MRYLLPVHLVITMSSYNRNFGTLSTENVHTNTINQYWNQNLDPSLNVQQNNQGIEQIKNTHLRECNTSAFAELFEDLHRYIQQEQNSSLLINESEYFHDAQAPAPGSQNEYYGYNTFRPIKNLDRFPSNIPVQGTCPQILSHHSGIVHRAHISLVPTTSGTLKTITKRKRKRTIFTTEQVEELEKYFSKKPYVTREDRQVLVKQLNINDKAVKIWFQNRRLKCKRDQCQSPVSDNVMLDTNPHDFDLDYIESQIKQNTDKYGYVTLDDTMMDYLVNIIDTCLENSNYKTTIEEASTEHQSSPIYEPISPPDSTKEDENLQWQQHELSESDQTLLSLHNYTVI